MIITLKSKTKTELIDITSKVNQIVQENGVENGFCLIFVPHTTAGITINENADPDVKLDILTLFRWRNLPSLLDKTSP